MDWGVDYPAADREDLVLYVWVDAPIEYIASTKQYSERVGADEYDWKAAWKPGGESRYGPRFEDSWQAESGELVHIIGRDIIQQHCVFWPAMLRAAGYSEPRAVLATGFVNIDGDALSTSRNRAVWAEEYLDAGFHPDLFRYYITTGSGLSNDVDFSWDRFAERVNGELVGNLGNFCYRALLFADRNYDGTPDVTVSDEIRGQIADAVETFETAVREYDVRTLGQVAVDLADVGNEYIQRNEPWNLVGDDPDRAAQVIRDCVQLTRACAVLMQPVMPEKAQTLWAQLGEDGQVSETSLDDALEPPADEFGDPAELFEQVEDDQIERLNEDLRERVADAGDSEDSEDEAGADPVEVDTNGGEGTDSADVDASESDDVAGDDSADEDGETVLDPVETDRIGFEQFQDLDMRVGEILVADPIEGADDLVRLEVDIGVEERQVVAGIKQLHDLDSLPGTRVVLLANMERAELFGHESNGMVLAAGEEADLLTTHEDAPLGSRIR